MYGNDVYYQKDPHATATQLTFTGDLKFIFNGVADWLYEGSPLADTNSNEFVRQLWTVNILSQ